MYGKSVKETVLRALFIICSAFVAALLLLCFWGMCSRDFIRFCNYAVVVFCLGVILLVFCGDALAGASAETMRKHAKIHDKGRMMYYESKTIINKNGEIIIDMVSDQELVNLKRENEALKQTVQSANRVIMEMKGLRAAEQLDCRNRYERLLDKYERRDDDARQYQKLLDSMREKHKADEKEWRDRIEIGHLEHMELWAWRKTEKARKQRDDKLRSRVRKIRKREKVNGLIAASNDLAAASKTDRECGISDHRLEISNAIIALAEYLKPHNPGEELQTYLWDCRTTETLLDDIRASIVKTAFGADWENRIVAGLIGLNIVSAAVPSVVAAHTVAEASKPHEKRRRKNKRPSQ